MKALLQENRQLHLNDGALAPDLKQELIRLEESIWKGDLEVVSAGPKSIRSAALSSENWNPSTPNRRPKWKRMILRAPKSNLNVVVKLSNEIGLIRRLYRHVLPTDRNSKAFKFTRELKDSDVTTVPVHSYGHINENGLYRFSFMTMDEIDGLDTLVEHLKSEHLKSGLEVTESGEKILRCLAEGLASAHNAGFFHGDIKPYHLYVGSGLGKTHELSPSIKDWVWIDLDDCLLSSSLTRRQRVINLYQIWRYFLVPLGEKDMDEFISIYLKRSKEFTIEKGKLKQLVLRHYERRLRRDKRRVGC